ncbi:MAG: glycine cleavage system protein H [Thermoanaerobaculia bacterium]|nr:glycine cleavage system protein H [Thermoanaerobaculia bacterium]
MDFLPMKGIEYLVVIGYLLLLVPFWYLLTGRQESGRVIAQPRHIRASWFSVPDWLYFHPGHAWAERVDDHRVRVGMDEFAHRLVGPLDALHLPRPGDQIEVGDDGWWIEADGHVLPVLSPVTGKVTAVNEKVVLAADRFGETPYVDGWLLEVEVPSLKAALRNLLHGRLATLWTEDASKQLSRRMSPELGTVLADGGMPVNGFARALDADRWWELAAEMLLVEEEKGSSD